MNPPRGLRVGWDELLDGMERALEDGVEFVPPAEVPVMPERLVPRARDLLRRQRLAEVRLQEQLAEAAAELDRRPRPTRRTATPAQGASLAL